jgi:hypothetical protein
VERNYFVEIDLELLEKDVFKEVISDGEFETIAVWTDGDWALISSAHFMEKNQEGYSPVCLIHKNEMSSASDTADYVEELIRVIEQKLNPLSISEGEPI